MHVSSRLSQPIDCFPQLLIGPPLTVRVVLHPHPRLCGERCGELAGRRSIWLLFILPPADCHQLASLLPFSKVASTFCVLDKQTLCWLLSISAALFAPFLHKLCLQSPRNHCQPWCSALRHGLLRCPVRHQFFLLNSQRHGDIFHTNQLFLFTELPNNITIEQFMHNDQYGRYPMAESRIPYVCGITGKSYTVEQIVQRVDYLSRAIKKRLLFDFNEGTEWDRVVGLFCLNTVSHPNCRFRMPTSLKHRVKLLMETLPLDRLYPLHPCRSSPLGYC